MRRTDCPSGKVAYPTRTQAKAAIAHYRRFFKKRMYYYQCQDCGRWHLTSGRYKERYRPHADKT